MAGPTPEARRPAGPRASRLRHYGPTAAYSSSSTYHGLESRRSLGTRVIQVCEKSAPKEIFFTEVNSLAREGDMFGQRPHDVSRSQPLRNQDGRWSEARSLAACKKSAHFGRLYGAGTLFATIRRVNRLDHAEDVHMLRPQYQLRPHVTSCIRYFDLFAKFVTRRTFLFSRKLSVSPKLCCKVPQFCVQSTAALRPPGNKTTSNNLTSLKAKQYVPLSRRPSSIYERLRKSKAD